MFVYRGYVGYTNFSNVWYGCVLDVPDLVMYEAETMAGLEAAFMAAVDDYIEILNNLSKKGETWKN